MMYSFYWYITEMKNLSITPKTFIINVTTNTHQGQEDITSR